MLGIHLEGDGLLLFVAQNGDLHGLALIGAQRAVPVGGGQDGVGADFENHVEGLEARGGSFGFLTHLLDDEAALHAKVIGHLRGKRLNQGANIESAGEERHVEAAGRYGRVTAGHDAHRRHRRGDAHATDIVAEPAPDIVVESLAVDQLHCQGLNVAVAADLERDFAARRNFAQQTAQLVGAGHVLVVDGQHDVVDLQPDLSGGCIVIDERDHSAANFLELEGLRFVGVHVGDFYAQVARRTGVRHQGIGVSKDGSKSRRLGMRQLRRKEQAGRREERAAAKCGESEDGDSRQRTVRPQKVFHSCVSPCSLSSGLRS